VFSIASIFSLLVGVAGWYYAFYSPAAARLSNIEAAPVNNRRVRLRRVNGLLMCAMAVCLFLGTASLERGWSAVATVALWFAVLILMLGIAAFALYDLRLTARLRAKLHEQLKRDPRKD